MNVIAVDLAVKIILLSTALKAVQTQQLQLSDVPCETGDDCLKNITAAEEFHLGRFCMFPDPISVCGCSSHYYADNDRCKALSRNSDLECDPKNVSKFCPTKKGFKTDACANVADKLVCECKDALYFTRGNCFTAISMPRVTRKWCVLPARDCSWREKVSKGNKIMYVYTGYVSDKCYEAQIGGRCACKYGYISVWGTCTKAELSSSSQGSQRHCFLLLVAAVTIATNGLLV